MPTVQGSCRPHDGAFPLLVVHVKAQALDVQELLRGGKCTAALLSTNEKGCGLFLKSYWSQLLPIIVPCP